MNFIKKSKGVISIFLILILIPVMTMSVVLVDGSRARSAKAMAEEISDLAAMSVLTNYNTKLKDDFGLFAIDKSCDVKAVYEEYLKDSLSANEGTKVGDSSSDKLNSSLYNYGNKYNNAEFWNLYNFNIENTAVNASKSLAESDVLRNQIVEYSKYRGPILLKDRLEILDNIQNVKKDMQNQKKTIDLLSEKEKIDQYSGDLEKYFFEIKRCVVQYNISLEELKKCEDLDKVKKGIDDLSKKVEDMLNDYKYCQYRIVEMIEKYDKFYSDNKNLESPGEQEVLTETQKAKAQYQDYETEMNKLKDQLEEAKNKIKETNDKIKEVEGKAEDIENSNNSDNENSADEDDLSKISEEINKIEEIDFENPLEAMVKHKTKPSDDDLKQLGVDKDKKDSNVKISDPEKKEKAVEKVTLEDSVYKNLPSRTDASESEDEDTDRTNTNIQKVVSSVSFLDDIGETVRDDALVYSYILGTFKTRITEKDITSAKIPVGGLKDYHAEWRYENVDGEHDLRENPKKNRVTKFSTSETEYIIEGKQKEEKNESSVYSKIYGIRMVNNLAAIYMNNEVKGQCKTAAIAASLLTEGAVPVQVFYNMFMVSWAVGETSLDLYYLTEDGYKVPLIKTKDSLYIENLAQVATAINYPETLINTSKITKSDIMVTYEDYLVLLLMTVPEKTRLGRVGDLIQLNMEESGQKDFKIEEADTYIEADSKVSIKYLFNNISQFKWGYNRKGISFTSKVYEGY